MTPHDLMANFEVLAEAPKGIQRLRELVLELAVRGKLVAQDSSDEPAADLVVRMRRAKITLELSSEFRARRAKNNNLVGSENLGVPTEWELLPFHEVCRFIDYRGNTPTKTPTGIRLVTAKNVRRGWLNRNPEEFISSTTYKEWMTRGTPRKGDVLFTTEAPLGNAAQLDEDGVALAQRVICLQPFSEMDSRFVMHCLLSGSIQALLVSESSGMTATGIKAVRLKSIAFPVPPFAEQHRIVARIDELMVLLDHLEAKRQERESVRMGARDSALAVLREALTPEDVETAWLRIQERFHELFSEPEDVEPLRHAILFLAGEGRLVPQDPREGTAIDLLEKNDFAKASRSKDGKPRKRKDPSLISVEAERPPLPEGWAWTSIDQCCEVVGGIQKTAARQPKGNAFPYLRVANVQRGRFDLSEIAYFELEFGELERWRLEPGDLLIVEGNGSEDEVGRCAMWSGQIPNCVHQNHIIRCRAFMSDLAPYLLHYLNSPQGVGTMKSLAVTTSGLYNLSVGKIRSIWFPLPPEGEQRRILQRVDELIRIVDRLKAALSSERQLSSTFAAAAVHHLDA